MQPRECRAGNPKVEDLLLLASTIDEHLITFTQPVESRTFPGIRSRHEAQVDGQDNKGVEDDTGMLREAA